MLKDPFVRSKFISPPTNFNHLVHVGPTEGRPNTRDGTRAQEQKSRGARSSGPQRPHSFSEAFRRPVSTGSDGLPGETDPCKDSPPSSSTRMLPPPYHAFRALRLTQAFCPSVSLLLPVVKRKPWTSLSSESVSCPQGSLSPAASLIQVSERPRSLPPDPESESSP